MADVTMPVHLFYTVSVYTERDTVSVNRCIYVNVTAFCFVSLSSDEEEEADGLEILMEAPEGFRNSDEDRFSESQVNRL